MVGLDFDGVYLDGFRYDGEFVIITGRMYHEFEKTVKLTDGSIPFYFRPFGVNYDDISAGYWKSYIINMMGITDFYEDTESQANVIKKNCKNCKVHKVINGKYIGEW